MDRLWYNDDKLCPVNTIANERIGMYKADEVDADKAKDMAIIQGLNIDLSAKKIRLEKMKERIRELEGEVKDLTRQLNKREDDRETVLKEELEALRRGDDG